ncbi:hypothetical protein [Streptomyces sp. Act143]|uniref:hypothetical protein n=1 Tax=Streptomyces sp. Act143 TaxID=2200760 RepID=UPI0015E7F787|nr:hypothetical protein [Streptomyces sp. Act143]
MSPKHWPPSTKDIEKAKKKAVKEAAASKERARRHRYEVARFGERALIRFPKRKGGD